MKSSMHHAMTCSEVWSNPGGGAEINIICLKPCLEPTATVEPSGIHGLRFALQVVDGGLAVGGRRRLRIENGPPLILQSA